MESSTTRPGAAAPAAPEWTVLGLYAGQVRPMPGDGRPTGIFKRALDGRVRIGWEGIEGDVQADRRVHGGLEKALHHFPLEHHRRLARQFPQLAAQFGAGAIGENLATEGIDESGACIGDVYALGSARIQLNQPRSPCWKIDAKFGVEGITRYIADHGMAGWYYRVLEPGEAAAGDRLRLLERNAAPVTLAGLWGAMQEHRPQRETLRRIAETPGLNAAWRLRLLRRADWLDGNAEHP
ncbi:MAG: MOSC domain-containing protein [Nevskia sp.]|nr:MOSC domain-containing protein [Nevskia sp.]